MRSGGLLSLARAFVGDGLRSAALAVSVPFARLADIVDPLKDASVRPPREWDPRLWDRGGDPRADNEDRRP